MKQLPRVRVRWRGKLEHIKGEEKSQVRFCLWRRAEQGGFFLPLGFRVGLGSMLRVGD